jgi:hypothetical protein
MNFSGSLFYFIFSEDHSGSEKLRQKLGSDQADSLDSSSTWNSPQSSLNQDQTTNSTPTTNSSTCQRSSDSNAKENFPEKKSRPPKMRLKKYLAVDTDVCLKRPLEGQSGGVVDKRRKLDLDMQLEVSSFLLAVEVPP